MKVVFLVLSLSFTLSAFARGEHVITVKDRLRYELWYQGIDTKKKPNLVRKSTLPEELARPLRNL